MTDADLAESINHLSYLCHSTAVEKGWYERKRELPELLMLTVSELSECLEAARNHDPVSEKIPPFTQTIEEVADCLIRLFDLCGHLKLSIGEAVMAKMAYNRTREIRHGGKKY